MGADDKIRVIIVDDIAETRENIRKLLQFESDIDVVGVARTGREGCDLARESRPDVILMDINMPEVDGYTLTAQIRATPGFSTTPIVALTANVMRGDRERSLEAGCDGYIQKPIDIDLLPQQIERYLRKK